ncbi:putative cytochrome P450 [Aspergillus pseudodeflectus]|uniref:Cytochrome P450 n=1 Tax=Aspergillus pseudodeflectus TaxID=176178 RepID=A0ABR4JF00_9EURO
MALIELARSLWHLLLLSAFLGTGAVLGICVYRLYFHPLAKYPGPLLAKLTTGYAVYHAYRRDLHTDVWACHEKYGDVVRYGPNRLIINSEPGLKTIYSHGANVHKAKGYEKVTQVPGVHASLCTLDNARHKKLRRLLNLGLSDTNIRAMDGKLRNVASLFASALGEKEDRFDMSRRHVGDGDEWTVAKNMTHWCDFFTFDVMSELTFGQSYNLLGSSENHYIIDGVLGQMQRFGFLLQFPLVEKLRLNRLLFPHAKAKAMRFNAKSRQIMEERKARGERGAATENDVFSHLLAANDSETGQGLSIQQLWVESNLLIIAGSDTSSTAMAALFFYLSRNPETYERVTKEIRSVFGSPEEVCQGPKLSSCSYLRACIQEAIRLSPAVSGAMWREVLPGGLTIPEHDLLIPAGCEVGTGIWSLNHSSKYFPDPLTFHPERWISEEASGGAEEVALAKQAFASFSVGPRNCVGKGLAMTELMLGMAAVLVRYDFRRAETRLGDIGEEERGPLRGQFRTFWAFTSLKDGPYIQFRPVKRAA